MKMWKRFIVFLFVAVAWLAAVMPLIVALLTKTPEWPTKVRDVSVPAKTIRLKLEGPTGFSEGESVAIGFRFSPLIRNGKESGKAVFLNVDGRVKGKTSGTTIETKQDGSPALLKEFPEATKLEFENNPIPGEIIEYEDKDSKLNHYREDRLVVGDTLRLVEIHSREPALRIDTQEFKLKETYHVGDKPTPQPPSRLLLWILYLIPFAGLIWVFLVDRTEDESE